MTETASLNEFEQHIAAAKTALAGGDLSAVKASLNAYYSE